MATLNEKIEALEKQLQQAKARKAQQDARAKFKQKTEARKLEDRQKFLLGSFVLDYLKKQGGDVRTFGINGFDLDPWLTRKPDREAFNLVPLNQAGEGASHA